MAEAVEVCRAFRNNGRCKFGDECKYEHSEGEPIEPPPRGQCFNFRDGGDCQFGERCRYLHGEDDDRFARRAAERSAGIASGERSASGRKRRTRRRRDDREPREKLDEICNNYLAGKCRYGEYCRRQHEGDVEQEPIEKIEEICNNYLKGRCRFGAMCRRQHPAGQEGSVAE